MAEELKIEDWLEGIEADDHWFSVKRLIMPGAKLRIDYGEGNLNNKLIHIRAILDDHYIVYRYWLKHKKRWDYVVEWDYWFFLLVKDGNIVKA